MFASTTGTEPFSCWPRLLSLLLLQLLDFQSTMLPFVFPETCWIKQCFTENCEMCYSSKWRLKVICLPFLSLVGRLDTVWVCRYGWSHWNNLFFFPFPAFWPQNCKPFSIGTYPIIHQVPCTIQNTPCHLPYIIQNTKESLTSRLKPEYQFFGANININ